MSGDAPPSSRPDVPHEPLAPSVVALGGGHGLAVTLQAARRYARQVTAVVSVADDGGSSGKLRASVGIPAPGDLRRCLVALADPGSVWARAFEYRFAEGELGGHALGNLIIAGLAEATGDFLGALDQAASLLGVAGRVCPATSVPVVLRAEVGGHEVVGQVNVAHSVGRISAISLVPPDPPTPGEVIDAILGADQVVIGPGSLYTSILAVCAAPQIREALVARVGGRVYVCNLRAQRGETEGRSAEEHLEALLDHGVPVDVMLSDPAAALPAGAHSAGPHSAGPQTAGPQTGGPHPASLRRVVARIARPDGLAHDPELLAAALAGLAGAALPAADPPADSPAVPEKGGDRGGDARIGGGPPLSADIVA
ncbi:MAG: gluconeogenesis factor YvcK family protein [Acidimicrobiales bacterium]